MAAAKKSEADLALASEHAQRAIAELLSGQAFIEAQISAHEQKVVELVDQLAILAGKNAGRREEAAPYRELLQSLSESASRDGVSFDALSYHASNLLREEREMVDELRRFAADVLCGAVRRPPVRGAPGIHPARDRLICALLEEIAGDFGLSVTRNRASPSPVSACDVVAMAMPRKARLPKTYSAVEAIWLKGQREARSAADAADLAGDAQMTDLPAPRP